MTTRSVVKRFNVIEHIAISILSCGVDLSLNPFPLQKLEKTLSYGVVMTVASVTHTGNQIVRLQKTAPIGAVVLDALEALLSVKWRSCFD